MPLAIVSRGSRESVAVLMGLDELVDHWTLLKDEPELVAEQRPTRLGSRCWPRSPKAAARGR